MSLKRPLVHVLAFCLALSLTALLLFTIKKTQVPQNIPDKIIEGNQNRTRGVFSNLTENEGMELQYVASIQNPDELTIFGSSEFGDSPYSSYFFLPDTLGIPTLGVGHAHHQCFSILCELLAVYDDLEGAKICIILSPSWFHTPGTNTEAFTEFVRPNFLARIACNESIPNKYKVAIGAYISAHAEEFTSLSKSMEFFKDEYQLSQGSALSPLHSKLSRMMKKLHRGDFAIANVKYQVDSLLTLERKAWTVDPQNYLSNLQKTFLASVTNNNLYVNDAYYQENLLLPDGTTREDSIKVLVFENNAEFNDFKLLVDLLAERNAHCSFVLQPVNPYYYQQVDNNKPLVDSITNILAKHQMPLLNMYALDTNAYKPAVLKDVMHLGDYGWMEINFFLDSIYHEH